MVSRYLLAVTALAGLCAPLGAEEMKGCREPVAQVEKRGVLQQEEKPFSEFTGKVVGKRVRMRTRPDLEAQILRELSQGDYLVVLGEDNGYYAVQPPRDFKAYVFRTFVLDNVVEGSHVNVRLAPDLESPVVAQLNTGDSIDGQVCAENPKWLEITPPKEVVFFVAKEYLEKAGDANFLALQEKRCDEVCHLLNSAYLLAQSELRKSFDEIDIERVKGLFDRVVHEYADFDKEVAKAENVLEMVQDVYLQKKIAFLESKTQQSAASWEARSRKLGQELEAYQKRLEQLQGVLEQEGVSPEMAIAVEESCEFGNEAEVYEPQDGKDLQLACTEVSSEWVEPSVMQEKQPYMRVTDRMRQWIAVEESLLHLRAMNRGGIRDLNSYYADEELEAHALTGVVERYTRPVKNRPGDYILRLDSLPVAYLYSTRVDLEDKVGERVTVHASQRPNHNFAFPAFFVHSVE